jgi:pilus assembly protein Flp/PilA
VSFDGWAPEVIRRFLKNENGATVVEYGLIVACLALTVIVGFGSFTDALTYLFSNNNSRLIQALSTNR